jgi:hypothetical protein
MKFNLAISNQVRRRKIAIVDYLSACGRDDIHTEIEHTISQKLTKKAEEEETERRVRRRLLEFENAKPRSEYDTTQFLDVPDAATIHACYRRFYDATSNTAVKTSICAVCGLEVDLGHEEMRSSLLQEIPNIHRLIPDVPHPAHDLFEGKLLEPVGVEEENGSFRVKICTNCATTLKSNSPDLPPPLSLANDMWIGRPPKALQILTFAEQLLIAQLYPRVFVFKLYPKRAWIGDRSTLQKGMRGTVSTFEIDLPGITAMVQGDLMPRPPIILASLITITFIGKEKLDKKALQHLFRVRRHNIFEALCCLKTMNTKYYGRVNIDSTRLQSLPEDDVPFELLSIVRQSTDEGIILQETSGYVPESAEGSYGNVEILYCATVSY